MFCSINLKKCQQDNKHAMFIIIYKMMDKVSKSKITKNLNSKENSKRKVPNQMANQKFNKVRYVSNTKSNIKLE